MARPGYEGIQKIKEEYADTHPEIVLRINELYRDRKNDQPSSTEEEFIAAVTMLAADVPSQLLSTIYKNEVNNVSQLRNTKKYYLQSLDLNNDSQTDYIFASQRYNSVYLTLYYLEEGQWKNVHLRAIGGLNEEATESVIKALKAGELTITRPKWNYLDIEGKEFQVREENW